MRVFYSRTRICFNTYKLFVSLHQAYNIYNDVNDVYGLKKRVNMFVTTNRFSFFFKPWLGCHSSGMMSIFNLFQPTRTTIKTDYYCNILDSVHTTTCNKQCGLFSKGMLFLQDNASYIPPGNQCKTIIIWLGSSSITAYSSYLGPSDFKLFGPLKEHLSTKHFQLENELKACVRVV